MKILETQIASCAFSSALGFAHTYFVAPDKTLLRDIANVTTDVSCSCCLVVDATDTGRRHDALRLTWSRRGTFLPATFLGSLTLRPMHGKSEFTLEGDYGRHLAASRNGLEGAADFALAGAAMRELLRDIVSYVEAEWARFEGECPTLAVCNTRSTTLAAN